MAGLFCKRANLDVEWFARTMRSLELADSAVKS